MALFQRLFIGVAFLSVVFGGFVIAAPSAFAAKECQCGCSAPGGALQPNGGSETCTTNADCTIAFCQAQCGLNGPGVVPAPLRGSRVYQCVEQGTSAPAPDTALTPGGGAAGTPGTGAGTAAPGTADGTIQQENASSTELAPSASSSTAGSLRFILPPCTETGNCVLSDIINTGIRFANFLLALSGVVFLMTFLYAGAKLLFLAYDSSAINQAKKMITGAIVGMVIIMVAGVAVRFVSSSLGVSSTTTRLPGATVRSTTN